MAEFWTWPAYAVAYSCIEMTSAAHVYGKQIVGCEAFTATDAEKWLGHPFAVKVFGDWALCHGVNRFVLHRYALQPWTNPERRPGMSMGPWGLHYERTQTWWDQAKPWHEYLARCQYLLQQGLFVADICYLAPEESPQRWQPPGKSKDAPRSVTLSAGQAGHWTDKETGSRWDIAGRAIDGELRGWTLTWLDGTQVKWFAWAAEYPDTTIYK